jgi:hypothetical protein
MDKPGDGTRHNAERELEEYARKLRELSPGRSYERLSVTTFPTRVAPTLITAASGFQLPGIGPYVAKAAHNGYVAYRYLVKGRRDGAERRSPGLNIIGPTGEGD